jgi:hypothetical protein
MIDHKDGEPLLQINVAASRGEICDIYETLDPESNEAVGHLSHALGVMIGKEDFIVEKPEECDEDKDSSS